MDEAKRLGLPFFLSGFPTAGEVTRIEEHAREYGLYASIGMWDDIGSYVHYARPGLDRTGVPNWAALDEELEGYADGGPFAIVAADIAEMTERARRGRMVAEAAVQAAARALDAMRVAEEFLASYRDGGDEFILVIPRSDLGEARVRLLEFRHQLLSVPMGPAASVELRYAAAARRDDNERPRLVVGRAIHHLAARKRWRIRAIFRARERQPQRGTTSGAIPVPPARPGVIPEH